MVRILFAVVLLQAFAVSSLSGFSTTGLSLKPQKPRVSFGESRLFADIEKDNNAPDDIPSLPEVQPPSFSLLEAVQHLFDVAINVFSVFLIGSASLSICGILLNLSGYGYEVTKHGLNVDTIEHMRKENQMRREYLRMGHEHRPPSSLPR